MTTYIVIEEKDSTRLINKINAMLVAGWQAQGGVAFNAVAGLYLQAMVMDEHILSAQRSNGVRTTTQRQTRSKDDS